MDTKAVAQATSPTLITTGQPPAATVAKSYAQSQPQTQVEAAEDFRLIIERDDATGAYVYTTIDRRTGEVVQRLPREDVLKMGSDVQYALGQVISATA